MYGQLTPAQLGNRYLVEYLGNKGQATEFPQGSSREDAINNLKIDRRDNDLVVLRCTGPLTPEEFIIEFKRVFDEIEYDLAGFLITLYRKYEGNSTLAFPLYQQRCPSGSREKFDRTWKDISELIPEHIRPAMKNHVS